MDAFSNNQAKPSFGETESVRLSNYLRRPNPEPTQSASICARWIKPSEKKSLVCLHLNRVKKNPFLF